MSIYDHAASGVKLHRNRYNLSFRKLMDIGFGRAYPVMGKFVLPGDVWKVGANMLIRYQPMMAPPLTRAWARVRYFFVPLRLVEEHAEEIITGSKNGKLIETALPSFAGIFDKVKGTKKITKGSFGDIMGWPVSTYTEMYSDACMPAAYWYKAYLRCQFDYYRDENLNEEDDFETFIESKLQSFGTNDLFYVNLPKDYFVSSLPWQLKGIAPTFEISAVNPFSSDVAVVAGDFDGSGYVGSDVKLMAMSTSSSASNRAAIQANSGNPFPIDVHDAPMLGLRADSLNNSFNTVAGTFNWSDIRTMAAQTRIFERLARCGSRYTEYLKANFGTSPADGTLQRAQYLGGFRQPIVTNEVVQTGGDDDYPVGTLRGHGISSGGNTIRPFVAKEFGVILGLIDVMPEIQYTQGIDREFSYKNRFDFFNPSFQNLSEQEVRNGELYIGNDGKNDETFGFQPMYQELRKSRDIVVGDMRDRLSYWTQAITFASRPNLNSNFISAESYKSNFMQPFNITDETVSNPIICDIGNVLDVYRPMIREAVPGLIDHN